MSIPIRSGVSPEFVLQDPPAPETYRAISQALEASSLHIIGSSQPRLLVIPVFGESGAVTGGFWGHTLFRWLHVHFLVVPELLRGQGAGTSLMRLAETEAQARNCIGSQVATYSFQAAPFYRKLGYAVFAELEDYPPGHSMIFLRKRLDAPVSRWS